MNQTTRYDCCDLCGKKLSINDHFTVMAERGKDLAGQIYWFCNKECKMAWMLNNKEAK